MVNEYIEVLDLLSVKGSDLSKMRLLNQVGYVLDDGNGEYDPEPLVKLSTQFLDLLTSKIIGTTSNSTNDSNEKFVEKAKMILSIISSHHEKQRGTHSH